MEHALSGTLQSHDQPSYSPVQVLAKYFIFFQKNTTVKGRTFQDIKDI
jgi:hypothetical protein